MEHIYWNVIKFATGDEKESTYFGPFHSAEAVTDKLKEIDKSGGYSVCEQFMRGSELISSTYGEWDGEKVIVPN